MKRHYLRSYMTQLFPSKYIHFWSVGGGGVVGIGGGVNGVVGPGSIGPQRKI